MRSTLISLVAVASSVIGQATQQQVAVVEAEYVASEYAAAYPDGFGINLAAQGLLDVAYGGNAYTLGSALSASATSAMPTITVTPEAGSSFNGTFTLMLADANPLGNAPAQAQGQYRHYLQNGATFGGSGNTLTLNADAGTVVTSYAGPGPAAGEGPHRYAWLLFQQPSTFTPQSNLTAAGTGPGHWYVNQYVSGTGLGNLVAASFFTVENGQATYSVVPTSSVNTATISAASTTGSAASGSGSRTSAAPSSTGSSAANSGAAGLVINGAAGIVALAAAVLFA